jgi:hypothetical protein
MRRRLLAFALTAGFGILPLAAQVCRLSVAGLNQSRRVSGDIHAECPEEIIHSAPFGNWGGTSNFGHKSDSHQFDGWRHNTRVCDNAGNCFLDCTDGWYEWNSCTDNALYRPPNCSLFNDANCSAQKTVTGINVHGTKWADVPVRCPSSSTGAAVLDQGGCNDVKQHATGTSGSIERSIGGELPGTEHRSGFSGERARGSTCAGRRAGHRPALACVARRRVRHDHG